MNEMDLFDELTYIDDGLILEAQVTPVRRPLRFRGLRKAAVLAAAVMLLVAGTVMASGDFGVPRPRGWVRSNSSTNFNTDQEHQALIVHDRGVYALDDGDADVPALSITKANATELSTETECQGQQLQIIQEAMILMPDGQVLYKANVTEGADTVIAVMDNRVDGVVGQIVHVRCTVAVLTEDTGDYFGRMTTPGPDGKVWTKLQGWSIFLPAQIGYDYPTGVDFRFPDMQFNYDGRRE